MDDLSLDMNKDCPVCGDEVFSKGDPVPYDEEAANDNRIMVLHFCSEQCRDEFKYPET